jgi:hypothetical protein
MIGAAFLACSAVVALFLKIVFLVALLAAARSLANCFWTAFASASAFLIALLRCFQLVPTCEVHLLLVGFSFHIFPVLSQQPKPPLPGIP